MNFSRTLFLVAISAASLFAQDLDTSAGALIGVKPGDAQFSHTTWIAPLNVTSGMPAIQNIFVVAGTDVAGLPCFNCVNSIVPSVGIVSPSGTLVRGSAYQLNNFYVDNKFTGTCGFTLSIIDSTNTPVVTATFNFGVSAGNVGIISTKYTVPTTAAVGTGKVSSSIKCGLVKAATSSSVYLQ